MEHDSHMMACIVFFVAKLVFSERQVFEFYGIDCI